MHIPAPREGRDGTSVVVADDCGVSRKVLRAIVRGLAPWCGTFLARDGDEALEFFSHNANLVRVVFLDMHMPKRGGVETAKSILETCGRLGVKPPELALLTGDGSDEARAACFAAGMSFFIEKPADPNEVALVLAHAFFPD